MNETFRKSLRSLLETCKTIPRIAHIKEAADKAQIDQKRAHRDQRRMRAM